MEPLYNAIEERAILALIDAAGEIGLMAARDPFNLPAKAKRREIARRVREALADWERA